MKARKAPFAPLLRIIPCHAAGKNGFSQPMACDGWKDEHPAASHALGGTMGPLGPAALHSLVDIVLDGQQVVAHGLESQFMEHWGCRVKATVQDEKLGTSLVWTLQNRGNHQQWGLGLLQPHRQLGDEGNVLGCPLGVCDCDLRAPVGL